MRQAPGLHQALLRAWGWDWGARELSRRGQCATGSWAPGLHQTLLRAGGRGGLGSTGAEQERAVCDWLLGCTRLCSGLGVGVDWEARELSRRGQCATGSWAPGLHQALLRAGGGGDWGPPLRLIRAAAWSPAAAL